MCIANAISLKKFFTYNNNVYKIDEKVNNLKRKNLRSKTKPSTVTKIFLCSLLTKITSINQINANNFNIRLKYNIFNFNEYIPKTHGFRDCIIDTDFNQIVDINKLIIEKVKDNKLFRKNKIDDLSVCAWDGVDINETNKKIFGLPEKEYDDGLRSYAKFEVAMFIGPMTNIIINSKLLEARDSAITKSGNIRNKTTGETKLFEEMWYDTEKMTGNSIDVHVFDALYLNSNVMNLINDKNKYFVIRQKNEKRNIYKDSKGIFDKREADYKYEIVEIITNKKISYSKEAKKKNKEETTKKVFKRELTNNKIGEKILINEKITKKKNSIIEIKVYEKVITHKEVWSECGFEVDKYNGELRVIKSVEKKATGKDQIIYLVTNMLNHDVETILKIMHARWNIENNGFRTLKERFNLEHIYIGEFNAINYIIQMIFLVFNLFELYRKIRLKKEINITWNEMIEIFKIELRQDKNMIKFFDTT